VAGPTMLFVTLKRVPGWKAAPGASVEDKQRGGWDKDRIADLTSKWRDMLFTGGFDVLCYELGPGKVMVTMQRGWNAVGVKDFLLEQPEVKEVEWDSTKYLPKGADKKKKKAQAKTSPETDKKASKGKKGRGKVASQDEL